MASPSPTLPVSPPIFQDSQGPNLSTPPPPSGKIFDKPREVTSNFKKTNIPEGMWTRCKSCSEMITNKELEENQKVCPKCQFHMPAGALERIAWLADPDSFEETDVRLSSIDALKFKGAASYDDKLKNYQKETGLSDAVISGFCEIDKHRVGMAVMDFAFLGASMGSVVGEKITRIIEKSTTKKCPVIIISASGGARMYEGMLSLMQMAKTSAALARHARARLPYLSVLTNPTMAGVMASFASLGDIILAEPKSMIGFAGKRVIAETTREKLPPDFQTAEFLLERGLLDLIVHRKKMRHTLSSLIEYMK